MRRLRRWWRQLVGEFRIRARRRAVADEIAAALKLASAPRLVRHGQRGHDSIYHVADRTSTFGVLRLVNPYRRRTPPGPQLPYVLLTPVQRLEREWEAYESGAEAGLTPQPLWRASDALLCEYLPYRPLQDRLLKDPASAWDILLRASQALHALHQTGVTHMDASLANMLADPTLTRIVLIDFEYAPAADLSFAGQKVYDHLRLLESTWKFIKPGNRAASQRWLDSLSGLLDDEIRSVSLRKLEPALGRILNHPDIAGPLKRLFNQ